MPTIKMISYIRHTRNTGTPYQICKYSKCYHNHFSMLIDTKQVIININATMKIVESIILKYFWVTCTITNMLI